MADSIERKRIDTYRNIEFLAKQVVEGFITGLHKSPFHGFSVEFAEHRPYNEGESTRHIDWRLYARTEKLYTKRYEEETNLRCHLVIDHSSSMHFPTGFSPSFEQMNKLWFSTYGAAVLMQIMQRQRDACGLTLFSNEIDLSTKAKSSSRHHHYLLSELETLLSEDQKKQQKQTSTAETLHFIAESLPKRSLVVVFSDFFQLNSSEEELFSALQHLRHNKHEVLLFHVKDQAKEQDFNFDNHPHRFVDLESGKEVKIRPNEVRELYEARVSNYFKNLEEQCGRYKIEFIQADINQGFDQVLLPHLLKRKKLY